MTQTIDPQTTPRAKAFELWMKSPMPMVTLTKTFDIRHLVRISKKKNLKLNMLMCYCIGQAASAIREFYLLPQKDKMLQYDTLAVNVIVPNRQGGINSCDIHVTEDLQQFNHDYLELTKSVAENCESSFREDDMVIGTSTMPATELDCIVNQYTELFSNPMVMWGKYRKHLWKTEVPVSFQFHHVQMDGMDAARFLEKLQETIRTISIK